MKSDAEGRANFELAQPKRLILREERNFVETVDGTTLTVADLSAVGVKRQRGQFAGPNSAGRSGPRGA